MSSSRPKKPVIPPRGRCRRTSKERDAIRLEDEKRNAERIAECGKVRIEAQTHERVQRKIASAKAYGITKAETEDWDQTPRYKRCEKCDNGGWKRVWCPYCPCLDCGDPEHIAACCPLKRKRPPLAENGESHRWSNKSLVSVIAPGPTGPASDQIIASTDRTANQPILTFPASLKELAQELAENLLLNQHREIQPLDYPRKIQDYGGIDKLITDTLSYIHPNVFCLQDQRITPGLCRIVQNQQNKTDGQKGKSENGGYLDFVTDSRDDCYLRFYVGQSINVLFRVDQHILKITQGNFTTLHYYILQLGYGARTSNWLRLWTIPYGIKQPPSAEILVQNFLEMLFCRAFQSLPANSLAKHFGDKLEAYTNVGLNVLSPLLQGIEVVGREAYKALLRMSPEPEIRVWPQERKRQITRLPQLQNPNNNTVPPMPRTTVEEQIKLFGHLYRKLVSDTTPSLSDEACLHEFRSQTAPPNIPNFYRRMQSFFKFSNSYIPPLGKPDFAKLGLVVNGLGLSDRSCGLPPSLSAIGFHIENSLLWTYNFQDPFSSTCTPGEDPSSQFHCDRFTAELIASTKLKVILLFGPESEHAVVRALRLMDPEIIQLRGNPIKIWVKSAEQQSFSQVFISAPELHLMRSSNWRIVQQFSEIFRLASLLAGVNLDCYQREKAQIFAQIFRQRQLELDFKDDTALWTVATLNPLIRGYLFSKGFSQDDHLLELESLTGSLSLGICMLLHFFPRRRRGRASQSSDDNIQTKPQRRHVPFDKDTFQAVGMLYLRLRAKENSSKDLTGKEVQEQTVEERVNDLILTIHESFHTPPPMIIIQEAANIIWDDEATIMRYNEIKSDIIPMLNKDLCLLKHSGSKLNLSSHKEFQAFVRNYFLRNNFRAELLSSEGRTYKVNTRCSSTTWILLKDLYIPMPTELQNSEVKLYMELAPYGQSHEHSWLGHTALLEPDDPTPRLAIRYTSEQNTASTNWLKHQAEQNETKEAVLKRIFKTNSLVDILDGDELFQVMCRPRRYILKTRLCCWYTSDIDSL